MKNEDYMREGVSEKERLKRGRVTVMTCGLSLWKERVREKHGFNYLLCLVYSLKRERVSESIP